MTAPTFARSFWRASAHRPRTVLTAIALSALLVACGGGDDDDPKFKPLELTIAHINDHHSQLDAQKDFELQVDGVTTRVELGGFARVTSAFERYAGRNDVLKLHAGDAITGTLYYTLFKGQADADLMNTVCFDAMSPGNHEFDDGDAGLKAFIDYLHAGACKTPVLAANIHPAVGTPLAPAAATEYLKPNLIKEVQGVKVGIIGIDVKGKTTQSSRPLDSTVFDDEATAAQRTIDELKKQDIRHIVLLTHQGYETDKRMAAQLTDVDAIIGGDSHTLLGDFAGYGLAASGAYPTQVTNKDGKPVCIGQAWEYSKAVGEMRLAFNDKGELTSCAGDASLLVGGSFQRQDAQGQWANVDAATQQQIETRLSTDPRVRVLAPNADANARLATYANQVEQRKTEEIGSTSEALCLVRVPGESTNRSGGVAGCEQANQLARGSDIAQVVAESFLDASLRADVAIQNAGGVRVAVPAGPITMNTAFTVLPFTNVLVELPLTGAQLHAVLEDAVSNHLEGGGSNGSHPYAAGLRWHLDLSQPKGQRFSQLQARDRQSGVWSAVDPAHTYIVATNDFIASGKDGYLSFGPIYASGNYVNNYLLYTQTFVNYISKMGAIKRPAAADYSHQSFIDQKGVKLP